MMRLAPRMGDSGKKRTPDTWVAIHPTGATIQDISLGLQPPPEKVVGVGLEGPNTF